MSCYNFNFLEKNGVAGAFINGSTGEGVSLSLKEKTKITEIVEGVLSTSQLIDEGQEQVTDIIKKVANNQTFKAQFLKELNRMKSTLTLDDLTTFGQQVHKMPD